MWFTRAAGIASSGSTYVPRLGTSNWDFETGDFTLDGNWNDLDLSDLVPGNAKLVHVLVYLRGTTSSACLGVKSFVDTGTQGTHIIQAQYTEVTLWANLTIPIGSNGQIKYAELAGSIIGLKITVIGWWK